MANKLFVTVSTRTSLVHIAPDNLLGCRADIVQMLYTCFVLIGLCVCRSISRLLCHNHGIHVIIYVMLKIVDVKVVFGAASVGLILSFCVIYNEIYQMRHAWRRSKFKKMTIPVGDQHKRVSKHYYFILTH